MKRILILCFSLSALAVLSLVRGDSGKTRIAAAVAQPRAGFFR